MEVSKTLLSTIMRITQSAAHEYDLMLARCDTVQKRVQLLLDMSTLDCNKPIVTQLLRELLPSSANCLTGLDENSHHDRSILFPLGTFIRIERQHDEHDYPVPSYAVVCGTMRRRGHFSTREKTFMQALRVDGTRGSNLFVYNPFDPHFYVFPDEAECAAYVATLAPTLEARALCQQLEVLNEQR